MANPNLEWALTLAQKLAVLPQEIQKASENRDKAIAKLAELDAEIATEALIFPLFDDKEGKRRAQKSEWEYKVAVQHLQAYCYPDALDGDEPMQMANQLYQDTLALVREVNNEHSKLVREWDSIDRILSIYKRAL